MADIIDEVDRLHQGTTNVMAFNVPRDEDADVQASRGMIELFTGEEDEVSCVAIPASNVYAWQMIPGRHPKSTIGEGGVRQQKPRKWHVFIFCAGHLEYRYSFIVQDKAFDFYVAFVKAYQKALNQKTKARS